MLRRVPRNAWGRILRASANGPFQTDLGIIVRVACECEYALPTSTSKGLLGRTAVLLKTVGTDLFL